jgi:hypothetical protein
MLSSIRNALRPSSHLIGERKACATLGTISIRSYHSYPDPNEKPRISTTVSTAAKQIDKASGIFDIDKKFRLDTPFPGVTLGKPIKDSTTPNTISTKLENGLTVATQENPGLMTSFAFVVRTGRYILKLLMMLVLLSHFFFWGLACCEVPMKTRVSPIPITRPEQHISLNSMLFEPPKAEITNR